MEKAQSDLMSLELAVWKREEQERKRERGN